MFRKFKFKIYFFWKKKIDKNYFDIDKKDLFCLTLLFFLTIFTGIYSNSILTFISLNTTNIFNKAIFLFENLNPILKSKIMSYSPIIDPAQAKTFSELFLTQKPAQNPQITIFSASPGTEKSAPSPWGPVPNRVIRPEQDIISQTLNKVDAIWDDLSPWQRRLLWCAAVATGFIITDYIEKFFINRNIKNSEEN